MTLRESHTECLNIHHKYVINIDDHRKDQTHLTGLVSFY